MKRITMILIATLTLTLMVYAQSGTFVPASEKAQATRLASYNLLTQSTERRTDTPIFATRQDAQKAIQEGILGKIAAKANNALRNSPSPAQVRNIQDLKRRSIVERGLKLLKAGKAATAWNATQLRDFASQVDQFIKEAEAARQVGNGTTQQQTCGQAKATCNDQCRAQGAGYWCFFDCRLEYMFCLVGTLSGNIG